MIPRIFLLACLVAGSLLSVTLPAAHAESVDIMNQKIMLEAQMETRLQQMLSSFLGTKNVIAVVKVSLHEQQAQKSKSGSDVTMRKWDENQEMVLPGVPAAAAMTKGDAPKKDLVRLGVASIDISVIIGKNLSAEAVDKVKKLVTATYGLDPAAGDTLSVETYGATADYFGIVAKELPFKNSEIILLLAVALFAVFLFGPFKGFLKNLNEALLKIGEARQPAEGEAEERAAADVEDKEDQESREPEQQRAGIGGFGGGLGGLLGSQDDALNLGKIISKDNIEDVRLSLANEPPEIIAKVIQRLPPALALTAVPQGKMAEVMKHFFATSFEKPEDIRAIMSRVKSRVEWSFGGAVRLGKMLQPVDRAAQEEVLSFLRADHPDFAVAVEGRLFRFTDLLNYDDAALKRIFRKVGAEPFARCMKGLPEDIAQQFNDKLGESITTLVANHLKTMVGAGGDSDAEMKILNAVEGLVKKGFIPPLEDVKQGTK